MMFSSNCFACLLLFVLATASAQFNPSSGCPPAGLLNKKLKILSTALGDINTGLDCVLTIIDEQCPCPDDSPECFETRVTDFQTALGNLIGDVANVTAVAPVDCPERTGAVFVASCNGTGSVAVVDPNGVIQNDFTLDESVTRWSVFPNGDTYGLDYIINNPFEVRCRATPNGSEIILGDTTDAPLTADAVGTGIAYNPDTDEDYVAITLNDPNLSGIFSFSRMNPPDINPLFSYAPTGQIQFVNGYLYMNDGLSIMKRHLVVGDWATVLTFSLPPLSFVVLDDGRIVYCDRAGALYIYDPAEDTYRQLRRPRVGNCCGSIKVSPCDSLIYVVYKDDADIEIYDTTIFKYVGSLTYTSSTPSSCPSIACDPTFCCA
ncbi:uncharacterized protein LOC124151354 [Haliotis rufescens]|uniref:uncharacterized protein LOC124151354 n=1 Tax=Haliotis rufescens TaxID=6454 RepID=UPI00201EE665|nr:uncharacterized protein LOC124151354 [Haliotis rufescens]